VKENIGKSTNAFRMKERQNALFYFPDGIFKEKLLEKPLEYFPKIESCLNNLSKSVGKQVIYTSFIKVGVSIISRLLESRGWINVLSSDNDTDSSPKFAVWDGSIKDKEKEYIKKLFNDKSNLEGNKLKLIIGSPSIKEGVSFKHVQDMHILDPVWNQASKDQIEGRVNRFCSHSEIPLNHKTLKRKVNINLYKLEYRNGGQSIDSYLYDVVVPKKYKHVKKIEDALKLVSVDYALYRKLYDKNHEKEIEWLNNNDVNESPLEIEFSNKEKRAKIENASCPKIRRPVNEKCPENNVLKLNKHGDKCCYKVKAIDKSIKKR